MFALAYVRHILGRELAEAGPLFERLARDQGFYSEQLMADMARTGTVRQLPGLPADVRAAFATALEIVPAWHLRGRPRCSITWTRRSPRPSTCPRMRLPPTCGPSTWPPGGPG